MMPFIMGQKNASRKKFFNSEERDDVFHAQAFDASIKNVCLYDEIVSERTIYLNDLPIAVVDGKNILYIHADHLGTPVKMTDSEQKVVWERIAEPFGETMRIDGPATLNIRFPGQYFDAESGLHYNLNRTYDPEHGIYTQSDPLGLLGGINPRIYVGNNPVNKVDPTGELTLGQIIVIGTACYTAYKAWDFWEAIQQQEQAQNIYDQDQQACYGGNGDACGRLPQDQQNVFKSSTNLLGKGQSLNQSNKPK